MPVFENWAEPSAQVISTNNEAGFVTDKKLENEEELRMEHRSRKPRKRKA